MSAENDPGHLLYLPCRAQKCLFGSGDTLSKKSVYNAQNETAMDNLSGEESDLGPMSPLAFTDHSLSGCNSSPINQYGSPLVTPEKSNMLLNAYLSQTDVALHVSRADFDKQTILFSALKQTTEAARNTPKRKIVLSSPTYSLNVRLHNSLRSLSPEQLDATVISEEIIPDTPQRQFGREIQNDVESPYKSDSPEYKLITPLGSESKLVPVPKLHKRKSSNLFETVEDFPGKRKKTLLKRHLHDTPGRVDSKLLKLDENSSIPRARAALFQEKSSDTKLKNFTLSTTSFYSNCEKSRHSASSFELKTMDQIKRRRSLPLHSYSKRSKKFKAGGINAGVSHSIRKPKAKSRASVLKNNIINTAIKQNSTDSNESEPELTITKLNTFTVSADTESSPENDSNKRFFKTKRRSKVTSLATASQKENLRRKIAVNGIVSSGQNRQSAGQASKQAKLAEIGFDITDLVIDEPETETSIEQGKIANILKLLEDDWADDDYDTTEMLTQPTPVNVVSPLKSTKMLKDVTKSPASELSSMTSSMNIKDVPAPIIFEDSSNNVIAKDDEEMVSKQKYYPLFNKGYSSNKVFEGTGSRKFADTNKTFNKYSCVKQTDSENQYQLDVGQKRFGATQCTECGVWYQLGDPEDENAHLNYHNSIKVLKFQGWKTERVVMEDSFTSSRIIVVEPDDPKQCWAKVNDILAVVDRELGLVDPKLPDYKQKKVYLYIREKSVLAVLVAEYIKTAHRMIPELLDLDCCTAENTPAKCGINIVWTAISHRRQGLATKLVDILRTQFYYGYVMSLDDIAFSIPTPSGKLFAEKYTKTRNFKVYS